MQHTSFDQESAIIARAQTLQETVYQTYDRVLAAGCDIQALSERAMILANENASKKSRYRQIIRIVDERMSKAAPHVACKVGCGHCCYIPVLLPEFEAERIGEAIGRRPRPLADTLFDEKAYQERTDNNGVGNPCPFLDLNTSSCSIYEHRPSTCRMHVTLDTDSLLCAAQPYGRKDVQMATLDTRGVSLAVCYLQMPNFRFGDIRDFF